MTIRELSGDVNLTKAQIDETQIIVTTPEKCWSQGFADLNIWYHVDHVVFELGIKRLKSWGLGHTGTDFGFLGHSLKGGTSSHERLVTSVGEHRTAHQSSFYQDVAANGKDTNAMSTCQVPTPSWFAW